MSEKHDSEGGGEEGTGVGTEEGNEDVGLDIVWEASYRLFMITANVQSGIHGPIVVTDN